MNNETKELMTKDNSQNIADFIIQFKLNLAQLISKFDNLETLKLFLNKSLIDLQNNRRNYDSLAVLNRNYSVNKGNLLELKINYLQHIKALIDLEDELHILNKKIENEELLKEQLSELFKF